MNHGCHDEISYNNFECLYYQVQQINPFIQKYGPKEILEDSPIYKNCRQSELVEEDCLSTKPVLKESQFLNVFVV
jgi:hypothetical protein